mgnify:CR=1 FL=1
MKYIFVAGAPGSKWSSVVKNIYYSPDIDRSDYSDARTYYHDASGEMKLMHLGAYFDPHMEFGSKLDIMEFLSKDTNFMYAQFSKAMFEIDDSSNNIEPEMVFSSKVPISFRHNSKHFDFSEFMFNFGSKRGQPSIMAFVFR